MWVILWFDENKLYSIWWKKFQKHNLNSRRSCDGCHGCFQYGIKPCYFSKLYYYWCLDFPFEIRDGHGTGLQVTKIFVPGTWVPKPEIPGLLSKSLGFGCPKEFCLCTVSAIFVLVQGVPGICVSWDPSPVDLPGLKYANSRSKLWIMQELFSKMSF